MSTQFPLEGKVDVIVNPSATAVFTVNFRVPEWSANFSAKIGDKTYTGKKGELLSISRKWKAGDHVAIAFDMPLQIIPGGISYPNAIAFKRGPQVLAIDQGLIPVLATLNQPIVINEKLLVDQKESLPGNWTGKKPMV